ncbi:MAG: DUF6544 family protein [Bacteroidota bacterium]
MKKNVIMYVAFISLFSCNSLENRFLSEVENEMRKSQNIEILTEKHLSSLPAPVQRNLKLMGIVGKPLPVNAIVEWEDIEFRMSPNKDWISVECRQFNSAAEPARFAYLKSTKLGINIFVGRDKYQNGEGSMIIKAIGLFPVQNVYGKEMNKSGLVTVLSEMLLLPGYAFQPYIKWEVIDSVSVSSTISYANDTVSGIFYFNSIGEVVQFKTFDRSYVDVDGNSQKYPWVVKVDYYTAINGLRIPGYVRAIWETPDGEYEYFRGKIKNIRYNVNTFN